MYTDQVQACVSKNKKRNKQTYRAEISVIITGTQWQFHFWPPSPWVQQRIESKFNQFNLISQNNCTETEALPKQVKFGAHVYSLLRYTSLTMSWRILTSLISNSFC